MKEKFDVLYADPAWSFSDKMGGKEKPFGHAIGNHYEQMTSKEIAQLNIKSIMNRPSWCFLWVPSALIDEGIQVMTSWGFKYKTVAFIWVKQSKSGKLLSLQARSSTRSGAELCLVGKRGWPKLCDKNIKQVFFSTRRKHSQKPDEVYGFIEAIAGPNTRKAELFARQSWPGWTAIGNEIDGQDIRKVIGVKNVS